MPQVNPNTAAYDLTPFQSQLLKYLLQDVLITPAGIQNKILFGKPPSVVSLDSIVESLKALTDAGLVNKSLDNKHPENNADYLARYALTRKGLSYEHKLGHYYFIYAMLKAFNFLTSPFRRSQP